MKIAILWTRLSGYLNVCLKELASREGVEIFVSHEVAGSDAPFDDSILVDVESHFLAD